MVRYFLHIVVALQVRAADIERNIGRVYHAVQQGKVFGYDILHLVRNKHLIAVELDFVTVDIKVILDFREVEDTRQVERIIHIEMDMEQGFVHEIGI